jgi:hypothetical protein
VDRTSAQTAWTALTEDERSSLKPRLLTAGHAVIAAMLLLGTLGTLATIKITTGVPIDRSEELDPVRAAVIRAALDQSAPAAQTSVLCVALEGRADPEPSLLDALADLDTLVVPASACEEGVLSDLDRKRWVTIRHVDWQWGGRAVVTAASDRRRQYHLRRRSDGWQLVAVRPSVS